MSTDEQAIGKIVSELEAAWNAGDGAAFASYFADDASFIHIYGGELLGRAAIEAAHRQILGGIYENSRNKYTLLGIKFLRPDVVLARVQAHLQFYEGGAPREIHARPTLVAARDNGKWQLVAFQNTRITEMPASVLAAGGGGN
jgi:uncharacterized protein (TIGR02246 family)